MLVWATCARRATGRAVLSIRRSQPGTRPVREACGHHGGIVSVVTNALEMCPPGRVIRKGSGLPVVAVHGNGVDHRLLLPLDPELEAVGGLERFYFDLPGFGDLPALAGRGGLQDLADWLVVQVRNIVGTRPCALLANSLGGLLARHVRAELGEQVAGLALIAPVVDPDPAKRRLSVFEVRERDDSLLDLLDPVDRDEFTRMSVRQTAQSWDLFQSYALPGIRAADSQAMARLGARYALDCDPDVRAGVFLGPTTVITGKQDHVVGFEDQFDLARSWYPRATYCAIDGAGHNVHIDQPETVHELVRRWAADLSR